MYLVSYTALETTYELKHLSGTSPRAIFIIIKKEKGKQFRRQFKKKDLTITFKELIHIKKKYVY